MHKKFLAAAAALSLIGAIGFAADASAQGRGGSAGHASGGFHGGGGVAHAPGGHFAGGQFAGRPGLAFRGGRYYYGGGRGYYPYAAGALGFALGASLASPWYYGGYYADPYYGGPAYYDGPVYDDGPAYYDAPQGYDQGPPQSCGQWRWITGANRYDWVAGPCT